MATVNENSQLNQHNNQSHKEPPATKKFEWIFILLSFWFVSGVHTDGWSHNNIPELESFFTPWHGLLYSGYGAVAALTAYFWSKHYFAGYDWQRSLPEGYNLSLIGAILFSIGGIGDMFWHIIFGIEMNVEAIYSPTHLLLAVSGVMIVSGPLRNAWLNANEWKNHEFPKKIPMILSATFTMSFITFFFQFAHPYHILLPAGLANINQDLSTFGSHGIGIAGIIIFTTLFMGLAYKLINQFELPFGTFTIIMTLNGIYTMVMRFPIPGVVSHNVPVMLEIYARLLLPIGSLITGLVMDFIVQRLQADSSSEMFKWIFILGVPLLFYLLYFTILFIFIGLSWSVHMFTGGITVAVIVSYLVYILVNSGK